MGVSKLGSNSADPGAVQQKRWVSTGVLPKPKTRTKEQCADRMAKMPRPTRTRRQNRAAAIVAERKVNRENRLARQAKIANILRYLKCPAEITTIRRGSDQVRT